MKNKKVFVELFLGFRDYGFFKCDGQIPYYLNKNHNSQTIICTLHEDNYQALPIDVPNFQIKVLKRKIIFGKNLTELLFIFKNARNIDILYQYHFAIHNFEKHAFLSILYKILNPKGILFMRLEADLAYIDRRYPFHKKISTLRSLFQRIVYKWYFKKVDIFGVIDFKDLRQIKEFPYLHKVASNKIKQQLNGFNNDYIVSSVKKIKSYNEKKNYIVTAGRLEDPVKGLDILLEALTKTDTKDWEVLLTGSNNERYQEQLNNFYLKNPSLKSKVKSMGFLKKSRKEYFEILNSSKIFVLPSRFDGMPHVIPEAMALGNVIVGSRHHGLRVATEDGQVGRLFDVGNAKKLSSILEELIDNEQLLKELSEASIKKAHDEFEWGRIVENVYKDNL